jgi:GTP cyclohydrolase I
MEHHIKGMLEALGENPMQARLANTPAQVAKSLRLFTSGTHVKVQDVAKDSVFAATSNDIVLLKDTEFYSLCEHHMLPFYGKIHVAYKPKEKILGLGTIANVIDLFAKRLQLQERLTEQIADAFMEVLEPHGVLVIGSARHFCMMMRGVKQQTEVVTQAARGEFQTNSELHNNVMRLLTL